MIGAKISSTTPKMREDRADRVVALSLSLPAAAPEHEPQEEVGEQRDDPDHRDGERHDEDVVVLDVAELVREHAFELDPVHLLEQPGRDRDRRVLRVAAGRERVGRGVVDDVEPRLREPARDAQPFDEVVVAGVLLRVGRLARGSSRSATLSLLKYETNDDAIAITAAIDEADDPAADEEVERDADERDSSSDEADDQERVFAACWR